jgi:phenylalanyl-tRNA synthetase alpha chain
MTSLLFRRQQQQLISVICRNTRSISSDDKRRLRDDRPESFTLDGERFDVDKWWNLSPLVIDRLRHRRLLDETGNPLNLLKRRIIDHLHANYRKPASGSPLFVICERLHRIVSLWQNYDSLLTPIDHISRQPSDAYYVNAGHVLRAHTSAHQHELIAQGLDNFVVIGDVYRRDEVDRNHYPCFHQLEGVRLFSADQVSIYSRYLTKPEISSFQDYCISTL